MTAFLRFELPSAADATVEQLRENLAPTISSIVELARSRIPVSARSATAPSWMTVAWLEPRLARDVPGARLLHVEPVGHDPGTTDHRRIALRWNEQGTDAGLPTSAFVKSTSHQRTNRAMAAVQRLVQTEVQFFASLHSDVRDLTLDVYAYEAGRGARFVLVVEDLVASGATLPDVEHGCSLEYASGVVDTLGRLHARFWRSPRFAGDLAWLRPSSRRHGLVLNHGYHNRYRRAVLGGDTRPFEVSSDLRWLMERLPSIRWTLERWYDRAGPDTVCHGDTQLSNTYRDATGTCRLLDWQLVHRANGMRDVANFMSSGLPPEVRRAHDDDLLERYACALAEGGVPDVPSLGELRDLYRLFLVQVLGAAMVGLAFAGRLSVDGAARRALNDRRLAAIDELEVAGYIRHRLGCDS